MERDICTLKQTRLASIIAICPSQVERSAIHEPWETSGRNYPP